MTNEEFSEWAQSPTKNQVLLVEITHKNGKVYLSDQVYFTEAGEIPEHVSYDVCLNQPIIIERTLDADSVGAIRVYNDGSLDGWLDYLFTGYDMDIFIGDKSWARSDFQLQYSSTIDSFVALSANVFEFKSTESPIVSQADIFTSHSAIMAGDHIDTPALYSGLFGGHRVWKIAIDTLFDRNDLVVKYYGQIRGITWDDTTPIANKLGTFTIDGNETNATSNVTFSCSGTMQTFKELFAFICDRVSQPYSAQNLADFPLNPDVTFYQRSAMSFSDYLDLTLEALGAILRVNNQGEIELYRKEDPDSVSDERIVSWITPNESPVIQVITEEHPASIFQSRNPNYDHDAATGVYHNEYNVLDLDYPHRSVLTHSYAKDSDAIIEARRMADLLAVTRRTYSVSINRISPEIHIGAMVNIYSPSDRWENNGEGLNALVVGFTQSYINNTSELIVWR